MKAKDLKPTVSAALASLLVTLLLLLSTTAFAAQETEPNDKLGQANTVVSGDSMRGTFGYAGDLDFYRITVNSPGRLRCSVTTPPANIRASLTLYNRHADYTFVTASAVNDGDDVHLTYDITRPGTYFIRLHDPDNHVSTDPYTFTATFSPVVDAYEPNNDLGQATLAPATTLYGTLFDSTDVDYYKIYVTAGSTLRLSMVSPVKMSSALTLYNPDLNYLFVAAEAVNPGDPVSLEHKAADGGFYYIRVHDADGGAHLSAYTLSIAGGNPGYTPPWNPVTLEVEDNGSIRKANDMEPDKAVSGTIAPAGDKDWFRLETKQAGRLTLSLDAVPTSLQLRFVLHDRSGNAILSGQPSKAGDKFSMTYDATAPGVYYLRVDDTDSQRASGESYTFSANLTAVKDPYEPNNDYGDATPLNELNRVNAYLFKSGDEEWYRVISTAASPLRVFLSDLPKNITPDVSIYNTSKDQLAGKTGAAGMDMELSYTLPAAGTYLVRVRDRNNNASTSPYTLTITGATFGAYAPTARIDQIVPGSIVVGDRIDFTGSGMDADGTISGYAWRSSIDGPLSTDASFSTTALSIGTHTLFFKVRDNSGIESTEDRQVVYVGSSVSDEVEPNDVIGQANEMAQAKPVRGKINQQGDGDFFKVYLARPGRLTCAVTNVPSNLRLYLTYYGRHLDYSYITAGAPQAGDSVILSMNVTEPGFYYLRIHDQDNGFHADYTYTLTASFTEAADPQETNNTQLDAFTLTTDTVQGYLFPENDEDWYRVWVDAGQTLGVKVEDTPSNLRPHIALYDRNRAYLFAASYAENKGDNPPVLNHPFTKAGYVYIRIIDQDNGFNQTSRYRLTVTGANPGYAPPEAPVTAEAEPNDVIGDANFIVPGGAVTGVMGKAGDLDWFRFRVATPGIVRVQLSPVPSSMRGRLQLYRDDASDYSGRDATNAGDSMTLETRVTRPGLYYLRVDDLNRTVTTDPYRLVVSIVPVVDVHEPNNALGDATILRDRNRTQAMIFSRGDEDWYRVSVEAGSNLQVTVADVPPEIRPQIEIFDRNGGYLTGKTATNAGQELTHAHILHTAMDCYIRIRHAGNNSFSTVPYTLLVNGARFDAYTPLAAIDSVSPNPAWTGTTVTLEGHGTDADGQILAYAWRSSLDGPLSASRVATVDALSPGTHTIYFKVMDNDSSWSPETSTTLYYGVPAPSEEEPNDILGRANPMDLGKGYTGKMDKAGDMDFFRITVPSPGRLTLNVTNPTGSPMRTYLTMYDTDAEYSYVTASANADGDPVTLSWDLGKEGNYFLRIHDSQDRRDGQYTATSSFQAAPDPYEPNPDPARAVALPVGDVIQGYIFPAGDEDWYSVQLPHPGTLKVSLTDMPPNLRGYITLYDSNTSYTYVYASANNDGDSVSLTYPVAKPGPYYIRIHDPDSDKNPSATYTLTTGFTAAPDLYEPNNAFGRATPMTAGSLNAYIFPAGDEDWYRIRAEAGVSLVMTVDNVPANLRPHLTLYGPNNDYLYVTKTTEAEGGSVTLTYTVARTGFYFLRVHDRDNDFTAAGTYRLTVSNAVLTPLPPDTPVTAETGNNRTFGSADPIDTKGVTGAFSAGEHWFRFETSGPALLALTLQVPPNIRSVLVLYDANYSERTRRTATNAGDLSCLSFLLDRAGVWYVRLYDADAASSTEPFTLGLSLAPSTDPYEPNNDLANAKPLTFGQTVSATIFPKEDKDWFRLDAEAPGILRLVLENVPGLLNMAIQVYDPNSSFKDQKEARNAGEPLTFDYVVPKAGTYYIRLYDRGDDDASVDPYSFTAFLIPFSDTNEPNDRFGQATVLKARNSVSGLIYPKGDQDWYTFTVEKTGVLTIQVAEADGIQPLVELYSSSKTHLKGVAAKNKGDDIVLTYNVTSPDRYYLLIRDNGNNDASSRPYVLTILGGRFDASSPLATVISLGPNPVLQGQSVSLSGAGFDEDGLLAGYEWVSDRDGLLGQMASLSTATLSSGMHLVGFRVRDNGDSWSAWARKRLHVTDSILPEKEYNNDIARANPVPLEKWISGRIYPANDSDFYKIFIPSRGYLSALIDGVPTGMRGALAFYDSSGSWMYITNEATNKGDWFSHSFFVTPGEYYLRIQDQDSRSFEETYGLFFGFKPAEDRYEPNGSLAKATPLDRNASLSDAYISREGDEDWYRVEIPETGRLSLSLTAMPPAMRGYITLYGLNGEYLYEYASAINNGEDVFLDYHVAIPGTYFIRVHDPDNEAHVQPYTFTTRFFPVVDGFEPNNTVGAATLLAKSPVSAAIFPAGDQDWYKVYAPKDATLSVSVTGTPQGMRPTVYLYDTNRDYTYTGGSANNKGDNLYVSYKAPRAGMYYIRVTDADNAAPTAPYTFAVSGGTLDFEPPFAPANQEVEPNNVSGQANDIPLAQNVAGAIDPASDYDWFRFYANAPGIVTVSATNIPAAILSEMWIYNADLSETHYRRTTNKGESNLLTMTVGSAGYRFVRLRDNSSTGSPDPYNLRVEHLPVVDPHEPNNGYGTATSLGQDTIQGRIFPKNDEDWYRIFVRNPGVLSLSLDAVPGDLRPHVYLLDADQNGKGDWVNTNPGVGGDDVVTFQVSAPGFYYIRVRDENGVYSASPYTLRVTGADFSLAPVLTPIGNREIDATVPFAMTIGAIDPDSQASLVYSAANLPPGASFDPATRTLRWTPTASQTGNFGGIVFTVSDGTYSATETVSIQVRPSTASPILAAIGNKTIPAGRKLEFAVSATDPEGKILTYKAKDLPSGAVFDPETRIFSWTPTNDQIRRHENIRFEATNGVWTGFEVIAIDVKADVPQVQTGAVSEVSRISAVVAGEVKATGGASVTERGVVYGRSPGFAEPEGKVAFSSGGTGKFSVTLEDLTPNTTYYARAYGVNTAGTGYGGEASFLTTRTFPGDVNGDGCIDLADAVLCLQILGDKTPASEVRADADVDGDGQIGAAELSYILQHLGGLRN